VTSILLLGGPIYSPSDPFADAMLINDGVIAWIGQSSAAQSHRANVTRVIELNGALAAPAFVDAHVHATSAGLALIGLDLTATKSLAELLKLVEVESRRLRGAPLLGHGWDESVWPEGRAPTPQELDRATHGSVVYLSRRDVHSAAVSSSLLASIADVESLDGYLAGEPVTAAAHAAVRSAALATVADSRREEAQQAFLRFCASRGIATIHECAGPVVSSVQDLQSLQQLCARESFSLIAYWGELGQSGIEQALALNARPGGDLFVDGSLGSHTAWLKEMYSDKNDVGNCYINEEAIHDHLQRATKLNVQAGFHAIGDAAIAAIMRSAVSISKEDPSAFRRLGHRIEHFEMATMDDVQTAIDLGMHASLQPTFDWLWGGSARMYAERLGSERARQLNLFGTWHRKGLSMAFGSDAPVTPAEPWEWIRSCLFHTVESERLTARAAFSAATRGGHRAAGDSDSGVLAVGAPAAVAIWESAELLVQTPDERVAAWSTDQRAGVPALPEISMSGELPRCLATINGTKILYEASQ
jgi:predicted amidohydrolase YtcJ